jgi:hemolysin activation/secretion protein
MKHGCERQALAADACHEPHARQAHGLHRPSRMFSTSRVTSSRPGLVTWAATVLIALAGHASPIAAGAIAADMRDEPALVTPVRAQDEPAPSQSLSARGADDSNQGLDVQEFDPPFPVGWLKLGFVGFPTDAFELAIAQRLRQIEVVLLERVSPDGVARLDHPAMASGDPLASSERAITVLPFQERLDAMLTRGALIAIDAEVRRVIADEFGLLPSPSLGIAPRAGMFVAAGLELADGSTEQRPLAIPAVLLSGHGERARWIWTRFHSDRAAAREAASPGQTPGYPNLEITLNGRDFVDSIYPPAWRGARFDVGAFEPTLRGIEHDQAILDALRELRVELGMVGSEESPLFVSPGTGGERVLVRVFDGEAARGTYTPGAFVAIDAAVRAHFAERFGINGVVIAPTLADEGGQPLWRSRPLPVSAASGQAGFGVLHAADQTGAERTWTLFYQDQRESTRGGFDPDAPLPSIAIDLLGHAAHPLIDGNPDTQRYRVSAVEFVYPDLGGGLHPDLPLIEEALSRIAVPLTRVEDPAPGWIAARPGMPAELVPVLELRFDPEDYLYASAGRSIAIGVQAAYAELYNWVGHFVQVDPRQIDPSRATRFEDEPTLRFWIQPIEVDEVRTVARAENARLRREDQAINNPLHERIVRTSPVTARQVRLDDHADPASADALTIVHGSIPRFRELEEYAARLNRHPGRRVDPVVTPGSGPGLVGIDYLINEVRPWLVLGEVSNTGTEETDRWRYRIGLLHTQLTNADDILQIDYLSAGFDESHAVIASYQRPLIPDRLWFRLFGNWSQYTASDVGISGISFEGESFQLGGELILNVYQNRDWFVDLLAGARYENVEVFNGALNATGREDYTVAYGGFRVERSSALASTYGSVRLETSLGKLDLGEAPLLGRAEPSRDWTLLRYEASHSFFLEPVLNPSGFSAQSGREDEMTLAHQLSFSARGQFSFDDRLLPNEQQTTGGMYTVRGYPESLLSGDSVHLFTAEYRFFLVRSLPAVAIGSQEVAGPFGNFQFRRTTPYGAGDWDLLLRAFADYAIVRVSDRTPFEAEDELLGIGIGAELLVKNNLSVRLDWGFAARGVSTTAEDVDQWDNRLHFSATVRF